MLLNVQQQDRTSKTGQVCNNRIELVRAKFSSAYEVLLVSSSWTGKKSLCYDVRSKTHQMTRICVFIVLRYLLDTSCGLAADVRFCPAGSFGPAGELAARLRVCIAGSLCVHFAELVLLCWC